MYNDVINHSTTQCVSLVPCASTKYEGSTTCQQEKIQTIAQPLLSFKEITLHDDGTTIGILPVASNSSGAGVSIISKTATILVSKTKTKTGLPLLLKNSIN